MNNKYKQADARMHSFSLLVLETKFLFVQFSYTIHTSV